jgi:uncharacterized membrane protein
VSVREKREFHVRNPLTVIAVFAGLAEISASIALPQLDREVQKIFVWFVMVFPLFLVGLFFFVLWKKHFILYGPSDFSDDASFLSLWQPASSLETEEEGDDQDNEVTKSEIRGEARSAPDFENFRRDAMTAEKLAIEDLEKTLKVPLVREVALHGNSNLRVDAAGDGPDGPVLVEVKFIRDQKSFMHQFRRALMQLALLIAELPMNDRSNVKIILVFVVQSISGEAELNEIKQKATKRLKSSRISNNLEVRVVSFEALQKGSKP